MANNDKIGKMRLLYILQMLTNTDEDSPITSQDIMKNLVETYGIETHRTTIPTDIETLRAFGYDIGEYETRPKKYFMYSSEKPLTLEELKIIIDTVKSSKSITKKQTDDITQKLIALGAPSWKDALERNLYTEGKLKSSNKKIMYIIDALNEAIHLKKKVSFRYASWVFFGDTPEFEPRHDGKRYVLSPFDLVYSGDHYYLIGVGANHPDTVSYYRVDKIFDTPEILDERSENPPEEYCVELFANERFYMGGGTRTKVCLECENELIDGIFDRFGQVDVFNHDEKTFQIVVNIVVSQAFYNWVFGFHGKVKIISPDIVKDEFEKQINEAKA